MALDKICVKGGASLEGTIKISGSKNSALPILAATLLTPEPCILHRIPDLSDINCMLQILSHLGADAERASGTVTVTAEKLKSNTAPYHLVRKMRASVCVLGPLLGREKEASVSLPGGCVIGDRPIDLHLKGFQALGAAVRVVGGDVKIFAPELHGATINLAGKFGSTVLGTDNVLMAAVLAEGTTIIEGAATEPEVVDLANFLNKMGAKITGAGTNCIVVEGVKELHGAEHEVIADRIEAGTFLIAGAIAGKGSGVTLKRVIPEHLESTIRHLEDAGFRFEHNNNALTIKPNGIAKPLDLATAPYPGFATDMQAQMCALLSTSNGTSQVTENIFPQRFMHLSELKRMGANIDISGSTAFIKGVTRLSAAPVMASDLRASAALLLAALKAEGTTEIHRVYHIDRGYENIDEKLQELGASIERMKDGKY